MEGTQPDTRPDVVGASRGQDDPERDADAAGAGPRTGASTEYAANAEAGPSEHGYVEGDAGEGAAEAGGDHGTAANLDPHEPPGQG
jgi:hypothetical protein